MNRKASNISLLEDLAFEASFKEITSNLLLCNDHHPSKNSQLGWFSFSSILSTNPLLINSQSLLNFVRSRLNYYLVGIMGDKIRPKYLQKFYESMGSIPACDLHNLPEIWVFLDCVLDDSIMELETHIAYPYADSGIDSNLIPTIINRSPLLKKLTINFRYVHRIRIREWEEKIEHSVESLISLQHLTSLTLFHLNADVYFRSSLLSRLGKSCPLLTHLSVINNGNAGLNVKDLLSIILGELVDELPLKPDSLLKHRLAVLQIPTECLTPLCFTLQHLELNDELKSNGTNRVNQHVQDDFVAYYLAFTLRHLPSLQKFVGFPRSFIPAIHILHTPRIEIPSLQQKFTDDCLSLTAKRSLKSVRPQELAPSPPMFSGTLPLTSLGSVWLVHAGLIGSVGAMCPSLKDVNFHGRQPGKWYYDYHCWPRRSPESLETALKNWPQLVKITLDNVRPEYLQSILNAFGPTLKDLTLRSCNQISLSNLVSTCSSLESLSFLQGCSLVNEASTLNPDTFLPNLKKFESDICLGAMSHFFEGISTLTRLVLNCSHIGNESSHSLEWSNIPQMWPVMETLHIRQCTGLTIDMLSSLVPQLRGLKDIYFPDRIRDAAGQRNCDLIIDNNRLSPIHIRFDKFTSVVVQCRAGIMMSEKGEEIENDDEDEDVEVEMYSSSSEDDSDDTNYNNQSDDEYADY